MSDFAAFNVAFDCFLNTGQFKIEHATLSIKQLQSIHDYLSHNVDRRSTPLEMHLIHVELIPFHVEELIEPAKPKERVLSGPPAEQELSPLLRNRVASESEHTTLRILDNLDSPRYFQRTSYFRKISYEYPKENVENTLLNLFKIANWKVIKLESVIVFGKDNNYLHYNLVDKLYGFLTPHAKYLKELSLKKVDLLSSQNLINFLKQATSLETLCFEDIERYHTRNNLIANLCDGLMDNSSLKQLDLGNVNIEKEDYFRIFDLLSNNYNLNKINLNIQFFNEELTPLHAKLTREMKKRARKNSLVRFKENELTKENIYKLAKLGLEEDNAYHLKLSVEPITQELIISHPSNEGLSTALIEKLPGHLGKYQNYLLRSWPISIDMNIFLYDQTTIGAMLLQEAYQLQNPEAMKLILLAGANLFETLPNQPNLTYEILSDTAENSMRKMLVNYIKNDLNIFVSFLTSYNSDIEMSIKLESIKNELDKLIKKLIASDQLPLPLKIFQEIGINPKKTNWENDLYLIIQTIRSEQEIYPINNLILNNFEKVTRFLLAETTEFQNKWVTKDEFNYSLCTEINQLLNLIQTNKQLIRLNESNVELLEQIKQSQERIEKIIQNKIKIKAKAKERAQIKEELGAELQAAMEVKIAEKMKQFFAFFSASQAANQPSSIIEAEASVKQFDENIQFFNN